MNRHPKCERDPPHLHPCTPTPPPQRMKRQAKRLKEGGTEEVAQE